VIIGRHQNTAAEICVHFIKANNINVARRLSGGGAVYHDLGNINFTFITDANSGGIDFAAFCGLMREALRSFGVPAEILGRNDIVIEGKKISGNAQYVIQGRVMHHGTLLYDTNLDTLEKALSADGNIQSKGIKSARSRVANIRPYMQTDMPPEGFFSALRDHLCTALEMREYSLTADEKAAAEHLRDTVYSQWSWNYGSSPPYNVRKSRRIDGCGTVEILLNVAAEGKIDNIAFYGDFFGSDDPALLAAMLAGRRLEHNELSAVLQNVNVSRFFHNMDNETFFSLLFE
jgi:lipoate-protein ligase A